MSKALISYHSITGHTKEMAEWIAKGLIEDCDIVIKDVSKTTLDDLKSADAVIFGSPTYYGSMAAPMKKLIDESVALHGQLEGKVGGAFSSSGMMGGGNETTIRSILDAFLVHGMIIIGSAKTAHFGPVAVGSPDEKAKKECLVYGKRISDLVKKVFA